MKLPPDYKPRQRKDYTIRQAFVILFILNLALLLIASN